MTTQQRDLIPNLSDTEREIVARIATAVTDGTLPAFVTAGRITSDPSSPLFASWALNVAERLAEAEVQRHPFAGQAATIHVGSDSYAAVVTSVTLFKTGARAGQARSVEVSWIDYEPEAVVASRQTGGYGSDRTVDVTHPSVQVRPGLRYVFTSRERNGRIVWAQQGGGGHLFLGYARDYRDPCF